MKVRFTQAVEIKKLLVIVSVLVFFFILLVSGYLLFFYNPEKPVKIDAESLTTDIKRSEVAQLFGDAVASGKSVDVLGAKVPIEVKKEGDIKKTEFHFNALAFTWEVNLPDGTEVIFQVRVSEDGQNWSQWRTVEEDEDGNAKDDVTSGPTFGRLIVLEGSFIQERTIFRTYSTERIPEVKSLKFTYIDSKEKLNLLEKLLKKLSVKKIFAATGVPKRPTDKPNICSRACWKADESIYVPGEDYAPVKKMVVHHTVTPNNDSNPAATVRAIYYFHNVIRGWGDIGYNFLIDQKNGTIYEGRYGGDGVIGAHARGYNRGSIGVAVLGDFRYVGVNNKVRNALHKIVVWKFYNHKIDPDKSTSFGNPKRILPSVFYHGQVGNTACAGAHLNSFVPNIKKMAHYMPQQIVFRDSSGAKLIGGSNTKTAGGLLNVYKSKGTASLNYIRKVSAFPTDGTTLPNDQNYSSQWDLAKLDALNVWKQTSGGNPSIKVAVLDTGVAYEDYNPPGSEIYTKGPDFVSTNFVSGYDYVNGDTHPNDDHGHGTTVASVIAESTNNSLGSASLAYNTSIMPVKVCGRGGWCIDSEVAKGVDFARSSGAKVISMSFGGVDSSSVIQESINSAWNVGIVVVASAGNDGKSRISFPARGNHVIGVGALTSSDTRASYSNYGTGLDLSAPGGDGGTANSGDLIYQKINCTENLNCTSFSYSRVAGTSLPAALVSASVALVVSEGTTLPDSAARFLLLNAQDLGAVGRDNTYGWGRIQPYNALQISSNDKPHPNGILVKSAYQSGIYLLDQGQKRLIPSLKIFNERFNKENIVIMTGYELNFYTQGASVRYPNGTLIKGSTSGVYALSNDQKRWVTSASIFESLGYEWENVVKTSDSVVNNYPTGENISASGSHPDGSLVTSDATNGVYLIEGGQKRLIPSALVFSSRFIWKKVIHIPNSELESYLIGANVRYGDGTLIKSFSNSSVYVISTATGAFQQIKRPMASYLTFADLGFNWGNIVSTSNTVVKSFTNGPIIY